MNQLQLEAAEADGRTILYLDGYLNERGGELLRNRVGDLLTGAPQVLALDFAATSLVNSIGISALLEIIEAAREKNTRLEFLRVPREIGEIFTLLGIAARVRVLGETIPEASSPERRGPIPADR